MVHCIVCVLCDWLVLLWFWFYDTQMKTALCRYFTGTLLKYKSPKITQIGSQTSWLEKAWLRFLNSGLPRKMSSQWQDSRNRTNGIGISNPTSDHSYSLHPIHVIVTVSAACTSHLHPWRFSVESGAWIIFIFFFRFFRHEYIKAKTTVDLQMHLLLHDVRVQLFQDFISSWRGSTSVSTVLRKNGQIFHK